MTTKTALIASIEGDIGRTDLTTVIGAEITRAIKEIHDKKFWFNQTRDFTFSTVADQYTYTESVTATIKGQTIKLTDFWDIDKVWLDITNRRRPLYLQTYKIMEARLDGAQSKGEPYDWSWTAEEMFLYPVPNAIYTVRVKGHYSIPAPASDGETDNPWMIHAYEFLRERVKQILYQTRINNTTRLSLASMGASQQMTLLRKKTSRKDQGETIEGSEMC